MNKFLIIFLVFMLPYFSYSQEDVAEGDELEFVIVEQPIFIAEKDAEPIEGIAKWSSRISKYCLENYPESLDKSGVGGKVYVSFVIEKDGTLTDIKILKGVHKGIDTVAMNAIRKSGNWIPAEQGNRKVRFLKRLPIKFNSRGSANQSISKEIPVAKIGDMEFMKFIHQKSKAYSIRKKFITEEIVFIRVVFDNEGFQKKLEVVKSTNEKLNKFAIKYVKSYKDGWILPKEGNAEKESIVFPVLFSTKLNIDNL